MAYVVISRDDSASGYGTSGGVSLTFKISELADLADFRRKRPHRTKPRPTTPKRISRSMSSHWTHG